MLRIPFDRTLAATQSSQATGYSQQIRRFEDSIDKVIQTYADEQKELRPNAYELIEAANDVNGG